MSYDHTYTNSQNSEVTAWCIYMIQCHPQGTVGVFYSVFCIRYKRPDTNLTQFIFLTFLAFPRRTHNDIKKVSGLHCFFVFKGKDCSFKRNSNDICLTDQRQKLLVGWRSSPSTKLDIYRVNYWIKGLK